MLSGMIKRICSLILAVGLLFTIVGCASNNGDTQSGSAQSTAQQIADKYKDMNLATINDGKNITIKVHLGDLIPTISETPSEEQPDVFNSTRILADAFSLIYPNVKIEWARTVDTSSSDSFLQYITTQLNSNTAPDIVFAWGSSFASRGWFYDYTPVLEKPNRFIADNEKWKDQFPKYIFSTWQVSDAKNRVLGLPLVLAAGTPTALYYNKDLFTELNIEVPTKWSEMFTVTKTLSDAGKVPYAPWGGPGSGNRKITTQLWDVQFSLGPFYAAKQADKLDYDHDGMQSQSELFRAAYEGHYFLTNNDYVRDMWKQVKNKYTQCLQQGYENADYASKWLIGDVGIAEDGLWRYPSELSNTERQYDFGVIPPVAIDSDSTEFVDKLEYTENGPYHPAATQTFNILTPSVEAHGGQGCLDACVAFLQFLTVPENNEMIVSEQKGKCISFLKGPKVPPQLEEYFSQPFPKVPSFSWPGGFTSAGSSKLSAILELWVKDQITDQEFYQQFDTEFKKDIDDFVKQMSIDVSSYKKYSN